MPTFDQNSKLKVSFFEWGWLTPAVLPSFELIGRGPFNTVTALYIAWGLFALPLDKLPGNRFVKILFVVLIFSFGLGVLGAHDPLRGLKAWGKYSFLCLTFFYTLAALQQRSENFQRLCFVLATVGLLVPLILVLKTALLTGGETFVPRHQLLERNMPFLLPFVCWAVLQRDRFAYAVPVWITVFFSYFLIIVFSAGRSALVGFLVASLILLSVKLRKKIVVVAPAILLLVFVVAATSGTSFFRGVGPGATKAEILNQLTSGRIQLWQQAIEHFPENPWLGVGMGNVRYVDSVITISSLKGSDVKVRHLHNFLLDVWYETGFIGLTVLSLFMAYILLSGLCYFFRSDGNNRLSCTVLLAAVGAILSAALFSFSYTSPQLTVYLFMLLGAIHFLISPSREGDHLQIVDD